MRWMFVFVMAGVGCSVIEADVRAVAEPAMPYGDILARAEINQGQIILVALGK